MGGSGTVYLPGLLGFSRKTWHTKFKVGRANKHLNHSWSKNHLETEPDSIQVDRLCAVHVVKALSVGIHSYLLPLLQGFPDVLPPHTLDPKVLELHGHVLVLTWHVGHVHRAHTPLATLPTNCSWAHLRSELKLKMKDIQNLPGCADGPLACPPHEQRRKQQRQLDLCTLRS